MLPEIEESQYGVASPGGRVFGNGCNQARVSDQFARCPVQPQRESERSQALMPGIRAMATDATGIAHLNTKVLSCFLSATVPPMIVAGAMMRGITIGMTLARPPQARGGFKVIGHQVSIT